jgi:hypothetical protein
MEHTDDFPHIEIALHVDVRNMMRPGGIALLFTESQGKFHAPWGGFVGGRVGQAPTELLTRRRASTDRSEREGDGDSVVTRHSTLTRPRLNLQLKFAALASYMEPKRQGRQRENGAQSIARDSWFHAGADLSS